MSGHTRRDVFRMGFAAAAVGATGKWMFTDPAFASANSAAATGSAPFIPYSAGSFLKSRLTGAPVDAARTAKFRSFMASYPDQKPYPHPRINGVGGNAWGTAYAMGEATDPVWKLTGSVPSKCGVLSSKGFHAPEWLGQMFSGTNDSPFCVIDRGSGMTVFAANAKASSNHTISVSSVGLMYHSSNGLHYKNPRSDDSRNSTSRGRISESLVIRRDLVDYGIANNTDLGHVLEIFLALTDARDGFCNPMVGCESKNTGGFGAEGERIAIAPSVDVTKRGLSPAGVVIARTLQNYGCYIGDNSGSSSALKAEQENTVRPVWGGMLNQDSLKGLTWNDFNVVSRGWQ